MKGKINLTCDAWQAENADGYFAVTGHWVEQEPRDSGARTEWTVKSSLFGFVRMNCSHDGRRLGHALFKIAARLKVEHKVRLPEWCSSVYETSLTLSSPDWVHYVRQHNKQ